MSDGRRELMQEMDFVGVDFGTTNSAVALAGASGPSKLVPLNRHGEPTLRSILFFDEDERGPDRRPRAAVGTAAIELALDPHVSGRLVQSIKSYLTNQEFSSTAVFGFRYALPDLISLILRELETRLSVQTQAEGKFVVAGRPAKFVGRADQKSEDLALTRLRDAYRFSGFDEVEVEFEPVAAAYAYATRLDHDERVLIADFGGGTSDFCILTVGPSLRAQAAERTVIEAVDGVGIAGDAFDARIVERVIAPRLGRGCDYTAPSGKRLPAPMWIYDQLKSWHRLSFINTRRTHSILDEIIAGAPENVGVQALQKIIRENLGFQLYLSVEEAKHALSSVEETELCLDIDGWKIRETISRSDFNGWIAPELGAISTCVDRLMETSQLKDGDIHRVFMTGGSSFIPAVRDLFVARFGQDKIQGGDELTSVATGLALVARDRWQNR